ncbi:SMP-30/gluconolactonase/LRE family protein [Puniceicoccaceae bacterium K14]|nr:SMP-30/gluconolactonase/LRE family protein [Puniceicoccaceae bacterium K14]
MKLQTVITSLAILQSALFLASANDFTAGKPLGATEESGEYVPISNNVKVFGSFHFAESCVHDPERNLIIVINSGDRKDTSKNDGYISLINPDGSVHTSKWVGPNKEGLDFENPLGSAIKSGILYVADTDHVRLFDLETGVPLRAIHIPGSTLLNGIAVDDNGTIYTSNTRPAWQLYKVTADGEPTLLVDGGKLNAPNGVAIDLDGNVVVANMGNRDILTYSAEGDFIKTEEAAQKGSDGVVILKDGTKYISSVKHGTISRIRPGQEAEVIATGIPSAASMCYDSTQNQLVIPMNTNNAVAFLKL